MAPLRLLLLVVVSGCSASPGSSLPNPADASSSDRQVGGSDARPDAMIDTTPEPGDMSITFDAHFDMDLDASLTVADMHLMNAEPASDGEVDLDAQASSDMTSFSEDATDGGNASLDQQIADILTEFRLTSMRTRLPIAEIEAQTTNYNGTVDFPAALRAALNSFLDDGNDPESPRSIATEVRTGPCLNDDIRERVRCFLNRDTAYFELYGEEGFAPEEQEPINANWVFILRAESLSDHIQWAIVHRNGAQPTYNYGFN